MASVSGEVKVLYSAEDRATPVGRQVQGGLRQTGQVSDSVADQMRKQWQQVATVFKVAVAAAIAELARRLVSSFQAMVNATRQMGEQLAMFTRQSGMAVEQIERLKYAAAQEGVEFETLAKSFPILSRRMLEAARGNETYAQQFRAIGVEVTDSAGRLRSTYDILLDMSDYMSNTAVPAQEKMAVAMALLGRRGAELIPFLQLGRQEIAGLGDEYVRVGGLIGRESVAIIKAFGDQSTKVNAALDGMRASFTEGLLPSLYALREWMVQNMPEMREQFAALGENVGRTVIHMMQFAKGLQAIFEAVRVVLYALLEGVATLSRQLNQLMVWLSLGKSQFWNSMRDDAEAMRQFAASRRRESQNNFLQIADDLEELNRLISGLGATREKMIAAGSAKEQAALGEAVETTEKTEKAKAKAVDTWVQEILRIREWIAGKEMELNYEGFELQRQQARAEYTAQAEALRAKGDWITALRVEVALFRELTKIDSAEEAERKKKEIEEQKRLMAEASKEREEAVRRMQDLLRQEETITAEILRLNKEQVNTQREKYQETWDMLMESTRYMEGETGKFAGLFMTGVKGQMDQAGGMDEYALDKEQLNDYYVRRIEAIKAQTQIEVGLAWERGESELEMLRYFEEEKTAIQSAYLARDLGEAHLQQQQKLNGYRNMVNITMGLLGGLASFTDKNNKVMFAMEKAVAIASTIINTNMAAAAALAPPPVGYGPVLGIPMAAKIKLMGYMNAALIAATAIGQASQGAASGGGAVPGGAGYQYETPEEARWQPEEEKVSRTININVYGSIVDHDAFARELIPSLERAFDDGAH